MRNKIVCFLGFLLVSSAFYSMNHPAFAEEESFDDAFDPVLKQSNEPTAVESGPEVKAKLEGIGIGGEKSFAIINGEVYRVGEQKDGIRVTQIRKKQVDIVVNGATRHLSMSGIGVKKEETTQDASTSVAAEDNTVQEVDTSVQTVETSGESEDETGKKEVVNEVQKAVSTIVGVKNDENKK